MSISSGNRVDNESQIYFPGMTIIRPLTRIRRERVLPRPGEVAVRLGQQVTPVQIVARAAEETGYTIIRASERLNIRPDELNHYLLVEEGAAIERGMPLVSKKGWLGKSRQLVSPIDGVLFQLLDGSLILQQTPTLFELRAMFSGRIANLVPNRGVVIETVGSLIQGVWSSGGEAYGKINLITESADEPVDVAYVGTQAAGNILVGGRLDSLKALEEAEANGARGIIVGSLPAALVQAANRFSIPIIITDGIGSQPMARQIFKLLSGAHEHEATLLGDTDIHQGQRPEIIIPKPTERELPPPEPNVAAVGVGQTVRILRGPYKGLIGTIDTLYSRAHITDIGTRTAGAAVRLEDSSTTFVPYANLDLIM